MKNSERLEILKDTIQDAIDQGATTVEEIHQHIAKMPLDAIDRLDVLGDKPQQLSRLQERTIGSVYAAIRKINTEVGALISDQFGNLENIDDIKKNLDIRDQKNSAK